MHRHLHGGLVARYHAVQLEGLPSPLKPFLSAVEGAVPYLSPI